MGGLSFLSSSLLTLGRPKWARIRYSFPPVREGEGGDNGGGGGGADGRRGDNGIGGGRSGDGGGGATVTVANVATVVVVVVVKAAAIAVVVLIATAGFAAQRRSWRWRHWWYRRLQWGAHARDERLGRVGSG
eukprot:1175811-Pleurochrysis_carterae.AAC.1